MSQVPPAKPGACFCEPLKAAECLGRLKAAISANSAVPVACLQLLGYECTRDSLLITVYRGNKVSACPKTLAGKISHPTLHVACYRNGALAFDKADHLTHRMLRRNCDAHVDVVEAKVPFDYFALTLPSQLMEHISQIFPYVTVQDLASALGYPHNVILAIPHRVV